MNIAGVLPRFQETLAAETLTRLDKIKADTRRLEHIEVKLKELANMEADLEKVLDTTKRIERHIIGMASGGRQPPDSAARAAARFEADYRQAVTQTLRPTATGVTSEGGRSPNRQFHERVCP